MKTFTVPAEKTHFRDFALGLTWYLRQELGGGTLYINYKICEQRGMPVMLVDFFNKCNKLCAIVLMAPPDSQHLVNRKATTLLKNIIAAMKKVVYVKK